MSTQPDICVLHEVTPCYLCTASSHTMTCHADSTLSLSSCISSALLFALSVLQQGGLVKSSLCTAACKWMAYSEASGRSVLNAPVECPVCHDASVWREAQPIHAYSQSLSHGNLYNIQWCRDRMWPVLPVLACSDWLSCSIFCFYHGADWLFWLVWTGRGAR